MLTNVAFTAIKGRMLVLVLFIQPFLVAVTGDTDRFHHPKLTEVHYQWLMRVMTANTVVQGKMPTTGLGMAAVAGC